MLLPTSKVLARESLKGMRRDFLYYLEAIGFVVPRCDQRGRVRRRWYDEQAISKIERVWAFYRKGMTPRLAVKMAKEEPNQAGLIGIDLGVGLPVRERVLQHTGPTSDRVIHLVPRTEVLVAAEAREEGGLFDLCISLRIEGRPGPFDVVFRRGSDACRVVRTDPEGQARVCRLARADLDSLAACDRLEIQAVAAPPMGAMRE